MSARNISVRMPEEHIERIDTLARSLGRSRAWVLNQATEQYLDYEEWFDRQVRIGLDDAEAGRLTPHEDVREKWEKKRARTLG